MFWSCARCDAAYNEEIGNGDADDSVNHEDLSKLVSGAGATFTSAQLNLDENPLETFSSDFADMNAEGFSSDFAVVDTEADGFFSRFLKSWTKWW